MLLIHSQINLTKIVKLNKFDNVYSKFVCIPEILKYWVGVQQGQPYLTGRSASLALVGHPSSMVSR